MIRINNLTKIYKSKRRSRCKALDNINLTLPNKGLVFVLGKSGSGKSTLLNLIGGLDNITKGSIIVDGNNISYFNEKEFCDYRNTHIGFIFQDYHLIDELTVYENIVLSLNLRKIEDRGLVRNALKRVDLVGYEDRYPGELSGGERQRVAIARAIVKKPRIILADEPTGNLDTNTASQIIKLLKELSKECLILIVSHNVNDAYSYSDRIVELSKGKVIKDQSKNPMYMDNVVCHNNNIYYPGDKILNDNDINYINSNISNETKIVKMDNKYTPTMYQNMTNEKVNIEKKSLSFFKELGLSLKFLKSKVLRIFFSSFMVSVIMVILALSQTIITFDSGEIISKEMNKMNQTSLFMEKVLTEEQKHQDLLFDCVREIEDGDIEAFNNSGYKEKIYEVLNYSIPISLHNNFAAQRYGVMTHGVYPNESLGTLMVDEDFLISKFGKLEYVSLNNDIHISGVYITDYIADSILLNNTVYRGKSYNDILGRYYFGNYSTCRGYINGIIKTNYKEKYKNLFENTSNLTTIKISELVNNADYNNFFNDIYSSLGFSYSLNKNFQEDFIDNNVMGAAYHHKMIINGIEAAFPNYKYVFCEQAATPGYPVLYGDDVYFSIKKYNEIFNTNYTESNINTFVPHKATITQYRYYDSDNINKLGTIEVKIVALAPISGTMYVSQEIFDKFNKNSIFTKGLYFDGNENIDKVIEVANELSYEHKNIAAEAIHTMTKAVDVFIPIFELVAIFLCIGIIFILVSFSTKMIKDKMHDIGILKAIGTQSKTIGRIFGLQIILIAILTILMSTFGYYYFIDMANDVLIKSLRKLAPTHVMLDLDFLTFKLNVVNINVILILVLGILSLFIPMLKIRKIKPVKIIKTKE